MQEMADTTGVEPTPSNAWLCAAFSNKDRFKKSKEKEIKVSFLKGMRWRCS